MKHRLFVSLSALALLVGSLSLTPAVAQDSKPDATGAWKWKFPAFGKSYQSTLQLKQEGEELTGSLTTQSEGDEASESAIADGSIKGNEITFTVTRPGFYGEEMTTTYKGKIDGDVITGTTERDKDGETISAKWNATRNGAQAKKAANGAKANGAKGGKGGGGKGGPAGVWVWTHKGMGGVMVEDTLKLKREGEKLTGNLTMKRTDEEEAKEFPIEDGSIKGKEITFSITRPGFYGEDMVTTYKGTLANGTIKGLASTQQGEDKTSSQKWEAKRRNGDKAAKGEKAAKAAKADGPATPAGNWKWTHKAIDGKMVDNTLKLEQDGETLTGVIVSKREGEDDGELSIADGSAKGNEISFTVTRPGFYGEDVVTTYKAKIAGDTLTGTTERENEGETLSSKWSAQRAK